MKFLYKLFSIFLFFVILIFVLQIAKDLGLPEKNFEKFEKFEENENFEENVNFEKSRKSRKSVEEVENEDIIIKKPGFVFEDIGEVIDKSEERSETENGSEDDRKDNHVDNHVKEELFDKETGVQLLTDIEMGAIENRFIARRKQLSAKCQSMGKKIVESFSDMNINHLFMYNQIFHEEDLKVSGCIPPKTGSTSWNHYWWGTSKFDGVGPGKYDSFQSQGNRFKSQGVWQGKLKSQKPEFLFLTTRHPIERLISGWNNILCKDKCRDDGRVKYSANVMKRLGAIYKSKKMNGSFIPGESDGDHMVAFNDLVEMLVNDFKTLDKDMTFDIHFHSYDSSCKVCDIPYKYIIKLETFAEDYQFLMRKYGFWENFNAKHKLIGIVKENASKDIDLYRDVLQSLPAETLQKLVELKREEMELFGYDFNLDSLELSVLSE